mgnify:CR=1
MTYISASLPVRRHNRSLIAVVSEFVSVWRQRQELRNLDTNALNDIGISSSQAFSEAQRPFWDLPIRCTI